MYDKLYRLPPAATWLFIALVVAVASGSCVATVSWRAGILVGAVLGFFTLLVGGICYTGGSGEHD